MTSHSSKLCGPNVSKEHTPSEGMLESLLIATLTLNLNKTQNTRQGRPDRASEQSRTQSTDSIASGVEEPTPLLNVLAS